MKSHGELYIRIVGDGEFEGQTYHSLAELGRNLRDVKGGVGLTIFRSLRHAGLGTRDVQQG